MSKGVWYLEPPSIPKSPYFSSGVVIPPGSRVIETGGQNGLAPEGLSPDGRAASDEPAPPDAPAVTNAQTADALAGQTRRALENVRAILAEAGAKPEDIFQVRIFLVEGQDPGAGFAAWQEFLAAHVRTSVDGQEDAAVHQLNPPRPPLVTVAIVAALALPEALVEIEARAAVPADGMNDSARALWIEYLRANPELIAEGVCDDVQAWSFGAGKDMADELLALVLAGTKRATASSLEALLAEREQVPRRGRHSVILDGDGRARCIIRTGEVTVGALGEVTAAFAQREGEGDGSREYWLEGHRRFFGAEHRRLGLSFSDVIPVIYEEFEMVWPPEAVGATGAV
ncbi:MAG: ASCH domain-containing protein [Spirochaetaceae bacterium]|nr:MAG: ASCH domain-containing protein [Spirochaetaceae bacterium]